MSKLIAIYSDLRVQMVAAAEEAEVVIQELLAANERQFENRH